jgi:hypothetical protein
MVGDGEMREQLAAARDVANAEPGDDVWRSPFDRLSE